jgi:hypothetical protein
MSKTGNIAEGLWLMVLRDKGTDGLSKERLKVCEKCPALVISKSLGLRCSPRVKIKHEVTGAEVKGCGCVLKAKTRVKEEFCPAGKWIAVLD